MSHLIQKLRMMNGESTESLIGEKLYLLLPIDDELKTTMTQVEELSKGIGLVKFKRAELTPRLPVDMNLRGTIVSHNDVFSGDKRNDRSSKTKQSYSFVMGLPSQGYTASPLSPG